MGGPARLGGRDRPAKGFVPRDSFFALSVRPEGGTAVTRALQGPIAPPHGGWFGASTPGHGLPRFRGCRFDVAYPLAQVVLSDPEVPVEVRLEAFNPLVPGDADRSGMPVAVLRYRLHNPGEVPVQATVCGSLQNFIGTDGTEGRPDRNRNAYRESDDRGLRGVFLTSDGVDPDVEQAGTMALATTADDVTWRTAWVPTSAGPSDEPLAELWEDLAADGRLQQRRPGGPDERRSGDDDAPHASLAASVSLARGETATVTFLLTWHFPNRQSWTPLEGEDNRVGNHYATRYRDARAGRARCSVRARRAENRL